METKEENKIREAEVFPEEKKDEAQKENTENIPDDFDEETLAKKTKSEARSRLVLIFVLGFLIGIAIKTEALKKITVGYDDYLMKIKPQSYDLNGIQTKMQQEREEAAEAEEGGATDLQEGIVSEGGDGQGAVSEQPEN